jgi:hypothetical protein
VFAGGMQMHARREPKTERAADQTVRQVDIENLASRFPVIRERVNVTVKWSGAETSPRHMPLLLTSRAGALQIGACIAALGSATAHCHGVGVPGPA